MPYPTELTLEQTLLIESIISDIKPRLRKHDFYDIMNAILYVAKTGCQWSMLPSDYPPPTTVYYHYRTWNELGIIRKIHDILIIGLRAKRGLNPNPTEIIIDSESVRWGFYQSDKGFDGHKKVKGIKRHLGVDENGLPISIHITKANVHDCEGGKTLINSLLTDWSEIVLIKADRGYCSLEKWIENDFEDPPSLECVKSNYGSSNFIPTYGRWVVERSFSWMSSCRRLMRNYEKYLHTAEQMFRISCILFLLKYFR